MKIIGIAIARSMLLNLAVYIYLLDFLPPYPLISSLISSLILILVIAYVNQCIDWKRQGSRKLLDLIKLQRANLGHGLEGFVILFLAVFLSLLGVIFCEAVQASSSIEMYQLSDAEEVGLIVIGMEFLILVFYIFNECRKQKAAKNNQSHEPGMVKTVGVAIARTLLLNLAVILCIAIFYSRPTPFLPPIALMLIVTYANRYIEWKRQDSHNPFSLLNPRLSNLRHGFDAFIIANLIGFVVGLGAALSGVHLESITDGMTEVPTYQPTLGDIGLIAIGVEIAAIMLYILNEYQKQEATKKKLAKANRKPLK